jgi:Flp pilus assembly protein TadG
MRQVWQAFCSDECGSASLEFTLWVVPSIFLVAMVSDVALLSFTRTDMYNVATDVARRLSIGSLTQNQVADYVRDNSMLGDRTLVVGTYAGADVVVDLAVNFSEASVFQIFRPIIGETMSVRVRMRREPNLAPT